MVAAPPSRTPKRAERVALSVVGGVSALSAAVGIASGIFTVGGDLTERRLDLPVVVSTAASGLPRGSRFTEAALAVADPLPHERALVAVGDALLALTGVAVALGILWLCLRLARSRGFTRSLSRGLGVIGIVVLVTPVVGRFLGDLASNEAAIRLGAHDPVLVGFSIDPVPFVAGIAIGLVATLCEVGTRLQHDTEGLV